MAVRVSSDPSTLPLSRCLLLLLLLLLLLDDNRVLFSVPVIVKLFLSAPLFPRLHNPTFPPTSFQLAILFSSAFLPSLTCSVLQSSPLLNQEASSIYVPTGLHFPLSYQYVCAVMASYTCPFPTDGARLALKKIGFWRWITGDAASCELKDAVLCELKGHLVRIALCASNLRPCSESSSQRRPQQRLWDVFLSNSSFISHRHCNEALLHFTAHDSDRRVVGIGRCCKATDGFLEGADGEVTASDCVDLGDGIHNREQHSVLWNLVQEIEPLDASRVSEGVSNDSKDAMKRTISGMLGLLPSDQFEVIIRTKQEELEKLLTSSVMTGYTLRNAEYRVCLQRSLGLPEAGCELGTLQGCKKKIGENAEELQDAILMDEDFIQELFDENWSPECDISPGLEQYINQLESKLFAAMEELQSYKQKTDSLDMSTIVRAEKNDLLDYLRSLDAEKVSELSCPSSSEVEEIVRHVVSRCLQVISATSYTVQFECNSARSIREHEDGQATLTINRDHLARLLFWCMLFGHYLRGLDYRLELSHTLRLCEDVNSTGSSG